MCRWLAYFGDPIPIRRSCSNARTHSSARACTPGRAPRRRTGTASGSAGTTSSGACPRCTRASHPAWNDRNLRELAAHVRSPLFFAHIRASTGTAVQETNTHPFRYGRWLFMHNGLVRNFAEASASSRRARTNVRVRAPPTRRWSIARAQADYFNRALISPSPP
jgi:predicted glutamine amidotransferase